MHSADKTARTEICDQALRLFAANGPDNVSLRQVAAAAEVSPSLVVHHFGGKAGLRGETLLIPESARQALCPCPEAAPPTRAA